MCELYLIESTPNSIVFILSSLCLLLMLVLAWMMGLTLHMSGN